MGFPLPSLTLGAGRNLFTFRYIFNLKSEIIIYFLNKFSTMPSYTLTQAASILQGKIIGNNMSFSRLAIDSRTVYSAESLLFVALKGDRHDGHRFVNELYTRRHVKIFLVSDWYTEWEQFTDAAFLLVDNTLHAMQQLASSHRQLFHAPLLAITGSNGKTVLKEWLFQLLSSDMHIVRSPKSYNSQIGVPLSLWLLEPNAKLAIIEAGISKPNEMSHLQSIIQPDEGIFTNIGSSHQENFLTIQQKVQEKMLLFKNCKRLFYCADYTIINQEVDKYIAEGFIQHKITWGKSEQNDLLITDVQVDVQTTLITGLYKQNKVEIEIPFTDEASAENAINAWLYLLYNGYDNEVIAKRMMRLAPVAMRLELKKGIQGCTLINDSYNSDIHSLTIALDLLAGQHQHQSKTLILSDILQSGKADAALYQEVATMVQNRGIKRVIGIGQALMQQTALFGTNARMFADTAAFIEALPSFDFRNEAILLKGARPFGFERILAELELRTHRTVLEINLNAMVHNLNFYRSCLKPETKIMVMVKAFSYGSGSYEIARMLEYQKVDYLAVAIADEGVTLRQAGVTTPIAVMNPEEGSHPLMIEHQLEPEIYSFRTLHTFTEALAQTKTNAYPIHIKLDTGMHRLGFMENELAELLVLLQQNTNVQVKSIFSHLATADDPSQDDFTRQQIALFTKMSSFLIDQLNYPIMRHLLNSPGIERFPEAQMEMVRLGIGLYGASCYNQHKLQHISTLKSTISQIKTIPDGETIGYGRNGKTNGKALTIGVIPIGYADGLNRRFGNGNTYFLVNGKKAKTIGNICMDLCMIDLTEISAKEGDEVIIFGSNLTVSQLAQNIGTISYEILTSVSPRVKRVYFEE